MPAVTRYERCSARLHDSGLFGSGAVMTLRTFADLIGAEVVDTIKVGSVIEEDFVVPDRSLRKARASGGRLAA